LTLLKALLLLRLALLLTLPKVQWLLALPLATLPKLALPLLLVLLPTLLKLLLKPLPRSNSLPSKRKAPSGAFFTSATCLLYNCIAGNCCSTLQKI
jgi:hypothetical protein